MMSGLRTVLCAIALLLYCDAAYVDTLQKCSIKDNDCMRALYQNTIRDISAAGIPELGIPALDPMHLENVQVTVMDALKLTLSEGVVKGIGKCQFKTFNIDIEKKTGTQEILCDITIKGSVSFEGTTPQLKALLGSSTVSGHGKGKVKLEKVSIHIDFPLIPFKKEDGEIYFKISHETIKPKYKLENAIMSAEKVFLGKDDISQLVVPYFNSNWKTLMKNFGQTFVDKALVYYYDFAQKFFEGVPAKNYIIEDLTPYIDQ